jgi:hypothetical protein
MSSTRRPTREPRRPVLDAGFAQREKETRMLTAFSQDQTYIGKAAELRSIYSSPQPVGDFNYADVTLVTKVLFAIGGSSPQLVALAQGSNDGVTWFDYALSLTATGETIYQSGGYVTAVFLRFKYTLSSTGSGDNWEGVTFDLHVNLTRK